MIKLNRAFRNLDRIASNRGKLIYECVWAQTNGVGPWLCIFALDLSTGRTSERRARSLRAAAPGSINFHLASAQAVPP
jgi:hypothetical protein